MKIVMLGPTGVGKTTYMASVYGILQRDVKGFTLRATDPEERKNLLELADNVLLGQYPAATNQRSEYQFELRYQGKTVLPITWADYRGGALLETQNSQQARFLAGDLEDADGLMIFCDCQVLAQNANRQKHLARIVRLVSQAVQKLDKPLSLAILLTKSDTIKQFSLEMLNPFQGLISAIEASDCIDGAFIPIACGKRIVNVALPLLFTLHSEAITQLGTSKIMDLYRCLSRAEEYHEKSKGIVGFGRWISDQFKGYATDRQLAASYIQDAMGHGKAFENNLEVIASLNIVVNGLPKVCTGITLKEYKNLIEEARRGQSIYQISSGLNRPPFDPFKAFE
ncbi:TRAFAC clade GTPase domain-containing protein [Roseofilum casamattae]|uniref:Double-GTPase 2 domain-containing protein n=1 Tax=Roseofilum casamattae BLCC-M143 TaxID=3022442 RepID=A0ABT7BTL7_9CYAN|nr:hypothetical protein [Roseofilum casamattae]MDJ1182536.1 hypothetical protein [Roseofilum casamattae BLCC-M143]